MPTPSIADELAALNEARAAETLAQVPGALAALIQRSVARVSLGMCLYELSRAQRREDIRRAAGRFGGMLFGVWIATSPDDSRKWTAEEWNALTDYGAEQEARALLGLAGDQ